MKLLILSQKIDINDDVLGFFHGWVNEFAKHCEKVIVICLQKGEYELPDNVKVLSLGKEIISQKSKVKSQKSLKLNRLLYCWRFLKYIWQERKNYNKVFVHMNTEYVVLGGWLWRSMNKKIGLWYAHGYTPLSLRIAEKLVNIIFTSTKGGCRIKSEKIKVVGQGIDIDKFRLKQKDEKIVDNKIFKIITIGRISPVKDYETLIKAVEIICNRRNRALPCSYGDLQVDIIGGAGLPEQEQYLADLKKIIEKKGLKNIINFLGAVSNKDIVNYLQSAGLFVNMSHTGSLDKAILEAMACGLPVLTCNEALEDVLGECRRILMYPKGDYKKLAKKIELLFCMENKERKNIGKNLKDIVIKEHSLKRLIKKIISLY